MKKNLLSLPLSKNILPLDLKTNKKLGSRSLRNIRGRKLTSSTGGRCPGQNCAGTEGGGGGTIVAAMRAGAGGGGGGGGTIVELLELGLGAIAGAERGAPVLAALAARSL